MTALEQVEVKGLKFWVRPDTSDIKAINEVVKRKAYGSYNFTPSAGEHWVDLGANVGAFSVWCAAQDESITVRAFEPDPDMCELIDKNLKLNGLSDRVEIVQAAVVADRRKTVTLNLNEAQGNVWRSSIERKWRGGRDVVVPALHINKTATAKQMATTWYKVDIEGSEMPIIEWMIATDNFPVGMVFEWSFDVDPSIARFKAVRAALTKHYSEVRSAQLGKSEELENWPASHFPAAKLVWCY